MVAWLIALIASLQLLVASLGGGMSGAPTAGAAGPTAREVLAPTPAATNASLLDASPTPAARPVTRSTASPAPVAAAQQNPVLTVTRTATAIDARLDGSALARVWRIDLAKSGDRSGRRIELTVETSDVAFVGGLTVSEGGRTLAAYRLGESFEYCDAALGICAKSDGIRTPAGNSSLGLRVTVTAAVTYLVSGAVREARDGAFLFGSWIEAAPRTV